MSLNAKYYMNCNACGFEIESSNDFKKKLGLPFLECPSCKARIPLRGRAWSQFKRKQKILLASWEGFKSFGAGLALSAAVLLKVKTGVWFSVVIAMIVTGFISSVLIRKKVEEIREIEIRLKKEDFKLEG